MKRESSQQIQLRKFKPSDLPQILKIEKDLFGVDAYNQTVILDGFKRAGEGFIVVQQEGKIVGYITGFIEPSRDFIDNLAVKENFQRKGLGKTLLDSLLKYFSQKGFKKVQLVVRENNLSAINFYEKNSFKKIKLLKNCYPDGGTGILMQLKTNE